MRHFLRNNFQSRVLKLHFLSTAYESSIDSLTTTWKPRSRGRHKKKASKKLIQQSRCVLYRNYVLCKKTGETKKLLTVLQTEDGLWSSSEQIREEINLYANYMVFRTTRKFQGHTLREKIKSKIDLILTPIADFEYLSRQKCWEQNITVIAVYIFFYSVREVYHLSQFHSIVTNSYNTLRKRYDYPSD